MQLKEKKLKVLEAIVNSIYDGVIVTDPEGKIIIYNNALAKLEELSPDKVLGHHLSEVYSVTASTSKHLAVGRTGRPDLDCYKTFFTNEGKEVSIVADTYPVVDDQGELTAVYSVCRNLTKTRELLNRTLELQEQIQGESGGAGREGRTAKYRFTDIKGASQAIKGVIADAKKAAKADCAVLVYGETGAGKELVVQSMHNYSSRKNEPFIAINCAAIPETLLESYLFGTTKGAFTGAVESIGLFEQAGQGTLFLDEINSMGVNLQAKLLRVLQERLYRRVGGVKELPVNCRIISSTNVDPLECIEKGTLRKDLFYRLAVISLYIPPLRERGEDVADLLQLFLAKYSRIYGQQEIQVGNDFRQKLLNYSWPGNVRELEHVVESAISLLDQGGTLTTKYLPPYLKSKLQLIQVEEQVPAEKFTDIHTGIALDAGQVTEEQKQIAIDLQDKHLADVLLEVEKKAILAVLDATGGNISRSAVILGISRQNLQYRMKKLKISLKGFK